MQQDYRLDLGLDGHPLGKNPDDVWHLPTASFRGAHHAVFPVALAESPILATCPIDGVVLDPFIELLWSVALSAVGALVAGTAAIVVGVRTDNATLAAFGGGLVTLPLRALFKTLRSWARRKR